jgi:hypothetical protein
MSANPTHRGAEGAGVFAMGARAHAQAISSLVPASQLPAVAVVALCQGCHPTCLKQSPSPTNTTTSSDHLAPG